MPDQLFSDTEGVQRSQLMLPLICLLTAWSKSVTSMRWPIWMSDAYVSYQDDRLLVRHVPVSSVCTVPTPYKHTPTVKRGRVFAINVSISMPPPTWCGVNLIERMPGIYSGCDDPEGIATGATS